MDERFFHLKRQLEELGYTNLLPIEAVSLVECLIADLIQTTRSLQQYISMSKEAIQQRDLLRLEAEPYKCDNAKLVKENNYLNQQLLLIKEEYQRTFREAKSKQHILEEEIERQEAQMAKLKNHCRDLDLKSICAETMSRRAKVTSKFCKKAKDSHTNTDNVCQTLCSKQTELDGKLDKAVKDLQEVRGRNTDLSNEVNLLQSQVTHRDNEIQRLNGLLEGGRPYSALGKDCCYKDVDKKVAGLTVELRESELINNKIHKQLAESVEKQHEAMSRAIALAEQNNLLEAELHKLDSVALKMEDECNKQLAEKNEDLIRLQNKVEQYLNKNIQLEKELVDCQVSTSTQLSKYISEIKNLQNKFNETLRENINLRKENDNLKQMKNKLEKNLSELEPNVLERKDFFSHVTDSKYKTKKPIQQQSESKIIQTEDFNINSYGDNNLESKSTSNVNIDLKKDLESMFQRERQHYENHISNLERKLTESIEQFNKHTNGSWGRKDPLNHSFVAELHNKICVSEQQLMSLKNENEKLKVREGSVVHNKDINELEEKIRELNLENEEITKENISLTNMLCQMKQTYEKSKTDDTDMYKWKIDCNNLSAELEKYKTDVKLLRKDRDEYHRLYKQTLRQVDYFKTELKSKDSQYEQLYEENQSFRVNSRAGVASADHLRDEYDTIQNKFKRLQSELIHEKTLNSQMRNLQLEAERSCNVIQNQLLETQKQLSITKDKYASVETKNKDLYSDILALQSCKSTLKDNISEIVKERDRLVIQMDTKTENLAVLEQQLKHKHFQIEKLEGELHAIERRLAVSLTDDHKLKDAETRIGMLIADVEAMTQQRDTAIVENKRMQNSLANVNSNLKIVEIEHDKSKKEVEGLKIQLQHYVAEVKRIEDLLSQKETERAEMLDHFASLSIEANLLESNNQSLENRSASKSAHLQNTLDRVNELEDKLMSKDHAIQDHLATIASLKCKLTSLENEITLSREERSMLERNISHLKKMYYGIESEKEGIRRDANRDNSDLQIYEDKIRILTEHKTKLESETTKSQLAIESLEKLLTKARREIVELKLALQDATTETLNLKRKVSNLQRRISNIDAMAGDGRSCADDVRFSSHIDDVRLQDIVGADPLEQLLSREIENLSNVSVNRFAHGSTL